MELFFPFSLLFLKPKRTSEEKQKPNKTTKMSDQQQEVATPATTAAANEAAPASSPATAAPAPRSSKGGDSAATKAADAKTVQQQRKERKEAKKAQQEAKKANPQANKRGGGGGGGGKKEQAQKGAEAAKDAAADTEPSKSAIDVQPLPGLRDFHPEQMAVRNWLFGVWKEVSRSFAFQEYDAPMLERQELYKRKAGEEIVDQMFAFVDKEEREVTLRPEMTPSLARLVLQRGRSLLLPIRWFSIPQCWRFETTTRGRKREHFQWNMDIFGVKTVSAEAELIAAIVTFFKKVGLTSDHIGIRYSSRKVTKTKRRDMAEISNNVLLGSSTHIREGRSDGREVCTSLHHHRQDG